METVSVTLGVVSDSRADANRLIGELQQFLQSRVAGEVGLNVSKDNAATQDAGSVLLAVFSAQAVVELAKGIADWMRKRQTKVTIDGNSFEGPPASVERILRERLSVGSRQESTKANN
jgi:hypothetical protein